MSLHQLLPLIAFLLNLSLIGIALLRNPGSRLHRVFAYFVSGMAVWAFGVFMLRRAPDEATAYLWEVIIHAGLVTVPVFYYHFVLIFLDRTSQHRPSLTVAYLLTAAFSAINLAAPRLLMKGVAWTFWGWAPATGPLYLPFFLYFNTLFVYGFVRLIRAKKGIESSFRRNRLTLILYGTVVTLSGGFIDFVRFILARFVPAAEQMYPVGIPANMLCALMLGTAIVRYRLFDINMAAKKAAVYSVVFGSITALLVLTVWTMERAFDLDQLNVLWVVAPLGLIMTLLLTPLGQRLEGVIERVMFSRRRGCYDTLLELSRQMGTILDFRRLVTTLVGGLVRGIPVTHCVLLTHDPATDRFVPYGQETATGEKIEVEAIRANGTLAKWLAGTGRLLVKEEAWLNPEIARHFEPGEGELERLNASLIAPLTIEHRLVGIVLLGEKLSGEIFDDQELEVLMVLANQTAISLENARLYEELGASNARLTQANRLKSQFLASMSHELRTPLNSIIGFSKVLLNRLNGDLTEQQETYIRSVHTCSVHLLQLINDILNISRIESGKVEMNLEEIALHDLVEECVQSSLPLVRGRSLKIEKEIPPELPRLRGDPTKLRQVLLNLLSNAIKFTAAGRVLVRVQAEPDRIHVSVADTGIGIQAEDLPRLFEPFQRLENPLARQAGGTGLGLAISKKFIDMHGGRIWAESREKQGSTFHFTLPFMERVG